MSVWNVGLPMGIIYNPLTDSPYVQQNNIGATFNPIVLEDGITTEGGVNIMTENGVFITTE